MNIQPISGYNQTSLKTKQTSFKEADFVEDYKPTPYEKEMDNLDKETDNLLSLMRYLYKDSPLSLEKAINEVYSRAAEQRNLIKTKYLKQQNFIQKLFKA